MIRKIGHIVVVIATVAGLAALMRYLAYGVNEDFGWGFICGAGLMTPFVILAAYFAEQDAKARTRAEMERERSGSIGL
ncbi:hypothetical protein ACLBXM_04920 [Xanthobacteraceae bacterium A53D]